MPAHEAAWTRMLARHGVKVDLADFRANTMGMTTRRVLDYYFRRPLKDAEAAALAREKEDLYRRLYGPKRRAMPGLRAFLRDARAAGVRLGVGTGSVGGNVSFILDGLRLRSAFDAVVDGSMVTRGKPDPETWLLLAERLGVRPKDCTVFEDSLLGEEAARRAGMAAVGVATSHRAEEFRHARLRVRDFRGIGRILPCPSST